MKRKLLTLTIAVLAILCLTLVLTACGVPAHPHELKKYDAKEVTCGRNGNIDYWYCVECDKYFTDAKGKNETTRADVIIVSNGHTFDEEHWEIDSTYHWHNATCEHTGQTKDKEKHTINSQNRCSVCDCDMTSTGLEFTLNDDGASYAVTSMGTCTDTEIIIPHTYAEKPVTKIQAYAFNYKKIQSIVIPDGVTEIGSRAFYSCSALTTVVIPDSLTEIGEGAFAHCNSLKYNEYENVYYIGNQTNKYVVLFTTKDKDISSLTIPADTRIIYQSALANSPQLESVAFETNNQLACIGQYAFYNCTALTSLTIPDSVTSIGQHAFESCENLSSLTVDPANKTYHSSDNCIIETASKTLIAGCKTSVIPDDGSVTSIGEAAFSGCTGLKSITIPDSVTDIGSRAFVGCTGLESLTIPDSVTDIESYAFYNCEGLTEIVLPKGITVIKSRSFGYCTHLPKLTIPESVRTIEDDAFTSCTHLSKLTIPEGVEVIGEYAFHNCIALNAVVLPSTLTEIGSSAFSNIWSIRPIKIYYNGTAENWGKINVSDRAFGSTGAEIYLYSETEPTDQQWDMHSYWWHYDDEDQPAIWSKKEQNDQ